MDSGIEKIVTRKVHRRIVYFVFVCFMMSSLDRVNISFAALHMNSQLHFTPSIYAEGVSAFFVAYLAFQLPVMYLAQRFGVRACIAGMLVCWGAAALAMSVIYTPFQFYVCRFVLGAAESAFNPVVLFYFGSWIPKAQRARASSRLIISVAVSIIIGAPVSAFLMSNPIEGFDGWRWMLLVEGAPAVLLGVIAACWLPNKPTEAKWLTPSEKEWLVGLLAEEQRHAALPDPEHISDVLRSRPIWACAIAWFAQNASMYGIAFWLPLAIKQTTGFGDVSVGYLVALPWIGAITFQLWFARHSDQTGERFWHFVVPTVLGALAMGGISALSHSALAYPSLCFALACLAGAQAIFWTVPMSMLQGRGAGKAYALINIVAGSAGIVTPNVIAWIRMTTGGFEQVGYAIAGVLLVGAAAMASARSNATSARLAETVK